MNDPQHQFPERFGPFILLRELGAGGMGSAYLALHPETDALIVVKRMHPELMRDDTVFKRFVHEAEVAAHVRHENVAALMAMGTIDNEPFLATEFVFGIQISTIIDRVENSTIDPIPMRIALFLALELASGVEAIHAACHLETGEPLGLIHRDVGARNVLVGFDGRVRLIDLGLGKSILSDWQTAHQVLAGSPDYMPPEQAMGARVDGRADVYACAVTIWEMLAGRKRIREESVAARLTRAVGAQPEPLLNHRPEATKRLEAILKQGMATDPDRRTPTADILRKTIEEELKKIGKLPSRQEVIDWLDTACATVIAKERRLLEESRSAAQNLGQPRKAPQTQMYVRAKHGPMSLSEAYKLYERDVDPPRPGDKPVEGSSISMTLDRIASSQTLGALAALVDPANLARAPLWVKIAGGIGGFLFVGLITVLTVVILTPPPKPKAPPPPQAKAIRIPPPTPPPPPVEPPDDVEVPPDPPPDEPPPPPPPPGRTRPPPPPSSKTTQVSASLQRRKDRMVDRIRDLRRVKFDIPWQKKLTKLSAKISSARSSSQLDRIDRELRRMERQ